MGRLTEAWAIDKGCGRNHGYTTPSDTNPAGASILPDYNQVFTPEQIVDHCNSILDKHLSCHDDGKLLFTSVQIIKQLQAELADPVFLGDIPASVVNLHQGCDDD